MNDDINIKNIINEAVCSIIKKSSNKDKIYKLNSKHNMKMHFSMII